MIADAHIEYSSDNSGGGASKITPLEQELLNTINSLVGIKMAASMPMIETPNLLAIVEIFGSFLYPMALSFIVTGTAWKWFLDPGIGLEHIMHQWGWESFEFDWIKNRTFAIYTVVIAAVWQSSGFVMAMFLAGLRGIDGEIMKAAQIDGASGFRMYRRIIIPLLRPAFLSAFVILAHLSIKAYDLVIALTNGGPGRATEVPATFMYSYTFSRNQMGIGATSAMIMLLMIFSIIIPYLYSELRSEKSS
jgi:glucose/mannose transport system permease protein